MNKFVRQVGESIYSLRHKIDTTLNIYEFTWLLSKQQFPVYDKCIYNDGINMEIPIEQRFVDFGGVPSMGNPLTFYNNMYCYLTVINGNVRLVVDEPYRNHQFFIPLSESLYFYRHSHMNNSSLVKLHKPIYVHKNDGGYTFANKTGTNVVLNIYINDKWFDNKHACKHSGKSMDLTVKDIFTRT